MIWISCKLTANIYKVLARKVFTMMWQKETLHKKSASKLNMLSLPWRSGRSIMITSGISAQLATVHHSANLQWVSWASTVNLVIHCSEWSVFFTFLKVRGLTALFLLYTMGQKKMQTKEKSHASTLLEKRELVIAVARDLDVLRRTIYQLKWLALSLLPGTVLQRKPDSDAPKTDKLLKHEVM